jgi:diadenosine tetraphosphate (Ap4A) HIT family hydrolase
VRISLDANYPWFLLIPQLAEVKELHHMSLPQQYLLTNESQILANAIEICYQPDKLNIASLGNVVPQLHIHHIARYIGDEAWPAPVWGHSLAKPYEESALNERIKQLNDCITSIRNEQ